MFLGINLAKRGRGSLGSWRGLDCRSLAFQIVFTGQGGKGESHFGKSKKISQLLWIPINKHFIQPSDPNLSRVFSFCGTKSFHAPLSLSLRSRASQNLLTGQVKGPWPLETNLPTNPLLSPAFTFSRKNIFFIKPSQGGRGGPPKKGKKKSQKNFKKFHLAIRNSLA